MDANYHDDHIRHSSNLIHFFERPFETSFLNLDPLTRGKNNPRRPRLHKGTDRGPSKNFDLCSFTISNTCRPLHIRQLNYFTILFEIAVLQRNISIKFDRFVTIPIRNFIPTKPSRCCLIHFSI